ncbi:MAG: phosphoribosylanthranilate isomerase [Betaproteobacteria bacterium]|nr:MAG: phosphoribosylanthranilate isomerase [Betaproteobacteria bacterium]TMH92181.1 MAG: phosphoribosylanthranilate isomerase [Betaproteobacteria bacterium]
MRTRVKICGITRVEDAQAAAAHGADAIGLIFYRPSPRCVSLGQARDIVISTPPFVATVAVFVKPSRDEVERVIGECGVTLLQFHGDEPPEFCSGFSRPYIKAARIRPGLDLLKYLSPYGAAAAWMLDAYHEDLWGGTGGSFDWGLVPERMARPTILSGGLTAGNVAGAIRRTQPYAVDVSSSVEESKGIKDAAKIAGFIGAVKHEDA